MIMALQAFSLSLALELVRTRSLVHACVVVGLRELRFPRLTGVSGLSNTNLGYPHCITRDDLREKFSLLAFKLLFLTKKNSNCVLGS